MLRRFYVYIFRARFKRAVSPSFLAAFFLLAAGLLALGLIFNQDNALAVRVGLLSPDAAEASDWDAALAQRIIRGVQYYGRDDCEIVLYTDEAQLKQDVAAHKLECGYAFHETGAIHTYRSPMTVADRVLDLLVAAAYMETLAGELGAETLTPYLAETDIGTPDGIAADIQARADDYLRDGALMDIRLDDVPDDATKAEPAPYRRLFHGLTGLSALLLALLCGMGLGDDTQKAALVRIKAAGRGGQGFQLAGFGVVFVAVGSFIAVTLSAGALLYPGLSVGWRGEWVMALAYAWALSGIAMCLSVYVHTALFPALLTLVFIFAALLGGVFFDLREILAAAAFLRFGFPNYYYLEGISRATAGLPWQQVILLTGAGLTTGALALKGGRDRG